MLGPNFLGNHTVHPDPGIRLPDISFVPGMDVALAEGRATEASRGFHSERWPIERIIERGYAVATFFYGDLFPDRADGRALSIQPLFDRRGRAASLLGRHRDLGLGHEPRARRTGVDARDRCRSRRSDRPFAPRQGGALGGRARQRFAARHRQQQRQGRRQPHAPQFRRDDPPSRDPLSALVRRGLCAPMQDAKRRCRSTSTCSSRCIAPRPVYIASAAEDLWADPKGEFLAALDASPVYRLLGTDGLAADAMPAEDRRSWARSATTSVVAATA